MDVREVWLVVGLTALAVTGAPIVWRTVRGILRGQFAADVVATLAIVTAFALRQPLAGLVIVAMQTGGEFLERRAARRASRALDELEDASPQVAHRITDAATEDIAADAVRVDDLLLVRPGELIPVDGLVVEGASWVDASKLTGESLPVDVSVGTPVMSGSLNGERPLRIRATAVARESQYARIVELVRSAQASKAPLQRIADRYAVWFTPVTILVCAATFWFTDDWTRVLAVLVVATPCPLILATPVAIVGGINHAARHGIIVRHGGALEALARVNVGVFDKTGTLTVGRPDVHRVIAAPDWSPDTILRMAAAVEQGSGHALARSVVAAASRTARAVPTAVSVHETAGRGVTGLVEGRAVAVGGRAWVLELGVSDAALQALGSADPTLRAFVIVDGAAAGVIEFADAVRPGVAEIFARLRRLGLRRMLLLSGDHEGYVARIATEIGVDDARGNLLPGDKVAVIESLEREGERVLMVGDGVNDAPALSRAHVGIALAAHGRGVASESADVVLLEDDVRNVAEAVEIGRKTMRVARQSILVGLGLSIVAMGFAALGYISPVVGALIQEGIDVAVIVNALRTSY